MRACRHWRWHLAPAALHFVAWSLLFVIPTVEQKTAIVLTIIDPWVQPIIDLGALGGLLVYGWLAIRERQAYQRWLRDQLSNVEEFRLTELGVLLVAMALLTAAWVTVSLVETWITPLDYVDVFPYYLLQSALAWGIGLAALR